MAAAAWSAGAVLDPGVAVSTGALAAAGPADAGAGAGGSSVAALPRWDGSIALRNSASPAPAGRAGCARAIAASKNCSPAGPCSAGGAVGVGGVPAVAAVATGVAPALAGVRALG